MESLLVFDVDGTLTGPRRRMHEDFSRFFKSICRNYPVFLVSGSDMVKLEEQLPTEVMKLVTGIFACSGNEFLMDGRHVFRMEHYFPTEVITFLEDFVEASPYQVRVGNHLETRTGTLNVSVVGRNADPKQRLDYFDYDNKDGERERLIEALAQEFPDYEANIGGQISVDITPRGWNKSRVYGELSSRYPGQSIAFFGDNMHIGGNDRPLGDAIRNSSGENQVFAVEDHYDTWRILQHQYCPQTRLYRERLQVASL
jgi:phosphomannomutase